MSYEYLKFDLGRVQINIFKQGKMAPFGIFLTKNE